MSLHKFILPGKKIKEIKTKFFTDKTVENEYLLIKLGDYLKLKDKSKWDKIFIDPHVYELTKSPTYSWEEKIDIKEFLDSLPENHYFSWDYPCDMNRKYTNLFINKTLSKALLYHTHPQYICTVQFKFRDYEIFVEWFDKYNKLDIASGILGIGNLCRFRSLNIFLRKVLDYSFTRCKHKYIHIYGLCLKAIPYAHKLAGLNGIELSIDSTKWTRVVNKELRKMMGVGHRGCSSNERQLFFDEYLKEINKRDVTLGNEKFKRNEL